MSDGGAAGGAGEPPVASPAAFWASRSLQVGLLPARARRGGPDGRSEESVGAGAERSGRRLPAFLAASFASASSSRFRWMAAFSSSSLIQM